MPRKIKLIIRRLLIMLKRFDVFEDNAGGLSLFVFDGKGGIAYARDGYEELDVQLLLDVMELQRKGPQVTETWEQGDWSVEPRQLYWQLKTWAEGGAGGAEIIADENGIYPDRMGVAGRRAFGLEDGVKVLQEWDLGTEDLAIVRTDETDIVQWIWHDGERIMELYPLDNAAKEFADMERQDLAKLIEQYLGLEA